jgi:large subunit ribosomal protein L22
VDVDRLVVETISVDQGQTAKRHMPRAMGRATPIHKKTSHVHVVLSESSGKRK